MKTELQKAQDHLTAAAKLLGDDHPAGDDLLRVMMSIARDRAAQPYRIECGDGWDAGIRCPECGGENCHPIGVGVNPAGPAGMGVLIDADGAHLTAQQPVGRGVQIMLRFACEEQHAFAIVLHFHKGATSAVVQDAPNELTLGRTIWRD